MSGTGVRFAIHLIRDATVAEYGDATAAAVKKLQSDLGVTADGRIGPDTVTEFNDAVANGTIKPA